MVKTRLELSQPMRLAAAAGYLAGLFGLAAYLNGSLIPPYGLEGLWFYSAAAALLLGEFLLEPFFTKPKDSIASAIALLFAVATVASDGSDVSAHTLRLGRGLMVAYGVAVLIGAVIAISFKDNKAPWGKVANAMTDLVGRIGRARWIFGSLLFAAGYAAFADSAPRVAVLYLTWVAIENIGPFESVLKLFSNRARPRTQLQGVVQALDDPNIVIGQLRRGESVSVGDGVKFIGLDALEGVVVDVTRVAEEPRVRVALSSSMPVPIGTELTFTAGGEGFLAGRVLEGTTLEEIVVATVHDAADHGLEEGCLVEAQIGSSKPLYQVVGADIAAQSDEDLRRHIVRARARKLGAWNPAKRAFDPVSWVPAAGSGVRLLTSSSEREFDSRYVGCVPRTEYGVTLDTHLAVTHNTAILGILGIGKTHLAWELIKRMLVDEVKVVVLDITGKYAGQFRDLWPEDVEDSVVQHIEDAISGNVANRVVRSDEAGNIDDFRRVADELLGAFVHGDSRLLLLNPNRFEVTRMEGRPFQGQANMLAALSMVEVTQVFAETLLSHLQAGAEDELEAGEARLCLVLEEAHSLVPEWNSTTNDSERQSVNGTVRAVLQGRKYGFGCILVTQRTANVTKSILNQCNTVFGLRVYDATGMGFLENYIGSAHARLLASLKDRQAVVFGRASSCNAPLVVELNDAAAFNNGFWAQRRNDVPASSANELGVGDPEEAEAGVLASVDSAVPPIEEPPF